MAACPYDAIFINPEDHSAEKCNFCAHRLDVGLEPACVVVCPIEAILVGDMDDPNSKVAQDHRPRARRGAPAREGHASEGVLQGRASGDARSARGAPSRRRPLRVERAAGRRPARSAPDTRARWNSSAAALLSYDVSHTAPWDWRVSLYTWTKGIAAGIVSRRAAAGRSSAALTWTGPLWTWVAPVVGGAFLAMTGGLLDRGSRASRALLSDLHAAAVAQLARARRVHHRRVLARAARALRRVAARARGTSRAACRDRRASRSPR